MTAQVIKVHIMMHYDLKPHFQRYGYANCTANKEDVSIQPSFASCVHDAWPRR